MDNAPACPPRAGHSVPLDVQKALRGAAYPTEGHHHRSEHASFLRFIISSNPAMSKTQNEILFSPNCDILGLFLAPRLEIFLNQVSDGGEG